MFNPSSGSPKTYNSPRHPFFLQDSRGDKGGMLKSEELFSHLSGDFVSPGKRHRVLTLTDHCPGVASQVHSYPTLRPQLPQHFQELLLPTSRFRHRHVGKSMVWIWPEMLRTAMKNAAAVISSLLANDTGSCFINFPFARTCLLSRGAALPLHHDLASFSPAFRMVGSRLLRPGRLQ